MSSRLNPILSVVIPAFNEMEVIEESISRIFDVVSEKLDSFEIIVIDDGSTDGTLSKLVELKSFIEELRVVSLARNAGHMHAITTGLLLAKGDYVVTIDSDLQDPPEKILEMYNLVLSHPNIEVVQAVRTDRTTDTFFKKFTASIYYRLARVLTGIPLIHNAADFRLLKRSVVDFLMALPEKNKIYRLLIPYFGFNTLILPIRRDIRFAGKSKYNLSKMLSLSIDSFISFSSKPLHFFTRIGLAFSLLFFLAAIASVLIWLNDLWQFVPGWTSLVFLLLMSNSLIIFAIGLVGEYVAKTYLETLSRPSINYRELT